MADDGDLVANFMAITGADDETAIRVLEAANFELEQAVNLFFAAEPHMDAGGSAGHRNAGGAGPHQDGGSAGAARPYADFGGHDGDDVRAPLPSKVERLYGDHYEPRGGHGGQGGAAAAAAHMHGLNSRPAAPTSQLDVFRDFRAEAQQLQAAAAAAAAGGSSAGPSAAAPPQQASGLSGLFKLPADLVFPGDLNVAMGKASQESKWLLLNVQSTSEFSSHRLNRDTWSNEALKEILQGTFVFYQATEPAQDAKAIMAAYRLTALPVVLVVDPLTKASLWQRSGFVDAEKLMEELVPFMDTAPHDAGAGALAQSSLRRMAAAPAAAAAAASSAGGGHKAMTEDDEMALAIAMSMGDEGPQGGAGPSGTSDQDDDDEELEEQQIWQQIAEQERQAKEVAGRETPEQVAAEAAGRLPDEPPEGAPGQTRVALRLPDGSRVQRRFLKSHPVSVLFDLCITLLPEAAAGRGLVIAPAMPGARPLLDPTQSLEASGAAGAMLGVKLAE